MIFNWAIFNIVIFNKYDNLNQVININWLIQGRIPVFLFLVRASTPVLKCLKGPSLVKSEISIKHSDILICIPNERPWVWEGLEAQNKIKVKKINCFSFMKVIDWWSQRESKPNLWKMNGNCRGHKIKWDMNIKWSYATDKGEMIQRN